MVRQNQKRPAKTLVNFSISITMPPRKWSRSIEKHPRDVEFDSLQHVCIKIHRQWIDGPAKSKKTCEHTGDSLYFDLSGTKGMKSVNRKPSMRCRIQFSTTCMYRDSPAMDRGHREIEKHSPPGG
ncbi:unnamed protein product [Rotaria magnacalcarata]